MWVIIDEKNRIYRINRLQVPRRVCLLWCVHFATGSCQSTNQRHQNGKYQEELLSRHLALKTDGKNPHSLGNTIYIDGADTHENISTIVARYANIFQKSKSHPKRLGAKK